MDDDAELIDLLLLNTVCVAALEVLVLIARKKTETYKSISRNSADYAAVFHPRRPVPPGWDFATVSLILISVDNFE